MTQLTQSTGQKSLGHAVLLLRDAGTAASTGFDGGNYLAWTGTDKRLNFSNRKMGESFVSSPFGKNTSASGPALVVMPDEMTAYYVFSGGQTDRFGTIGVSTLVRKSPSSYDWDEKHTVISIVNPPSPMIFDVSAHLGTQNGELCLNLAWVNSDVIQICQTYLGVPGSAVTFSKEISFELRRTRVGAFLMPDGNRHMLAYFDSKDNRLRLAHSTKGLFDFPQSHDCVFDIESKWRPEIFRLNQDLLAVLYTSKDKVNIAILGRAADGKYHVASKQEISQAETKSGPTGRLRQVLKDGTTRHVLTVAWSDASQGEIKYTDIDLDLPYIPIR